jgi:hypothetical protein
VALTTADIVDVFAKRTSGNPMDFAAIRNQEVLKPGRTCSKATQFDFAYCSYHAVQSSQ